MAPRTELARLWAAADATGWQAYARAHPAATLRFLVGRLYAVEPAQKLRAVDALGELVATPDLVPRVKLVDLLRRFIWALSDESGAVPFGIPEAFGEVLARCPELRPEYLPLLCAYLTTPALGQTGPVELGVIWALGRIGPPVAERCPAAVQALDRLRRGGDEAIRQAASEALARIGIG